MAASSAGDIKLQCDDCCCDVDCSCSCSYLYLFISKRLERREEQHLTMASTGNTPPSCSRSSEYVYGATQRIQTPPVAAVLPLSTLQSPASSRPSTARHAAIIPARSMLDTRRYKPSQYVYSQRNSKNATPTTAAAISSTDGVHSHSSKTPWCILIQSY